MSIKIIVQRAFDELRDQRRAVDHDPFVPPNTFGAALLEEEVADEPPQTHSRTLGIPAFSRAKAVQAF